MMQTPSGMRKKLGWFMSALVAAVMLSSSAGALNLDVEIHRHDADAADILGSLGRGPDVRVDEAPKRVRRLKVQLVAKRADRAVRRAR